MKTFMYTGQLKSKINKINLLKFVILSLIGLLYFGRSFNDFKFPYVTGDGFEYILMTEAFSNHSSPEIRLSDLQSFKNRYISCHKKWEDFSKKEYIDGLINGFEHATIKYKTSFGEFYANKSLKIYSYHFFTYSLINAPVYNIFKSLDPLRAFYITNSILVLIVCFFLLFYTPFNLFNSILAALCFCFSPTYWYLGWQHTEVFTMCFVALGLILFFRKKYYTALILIAIACTQNQPLIPLLGYLSLVTLYNLKISYSTILKVGAICFIAVTPPLFYYLNFETTSLIKDAGFLNAKFVTTNRILGFFFDLNQGMVLGIPFILLCFIVLVFLDLKDFLLKKHSFEIIILFPVVLIVICSITASMENWNHGMAIINRYSTWTAMIVMISAFFLVNKKSNLTATVLFNYFFFTQVFTTLYHQQFNEFDWSQAKHRPLAKWALRNHPEIYNPDPIIFSTRSQPFTTFSEENSPIIYFQGVLVKKILVHKNKIDSLESFGFSKNTINELKKNISYNYDWGYINIDDFKSTYSSEKIHELIKARNVKSIIEKIKKNEEWLKHVEQKAIHENKTLDLALYIDACYVYQEQENLMNKE